MNQRAGNADIEDGRRDRTGVLLCNLGTPAEPTPAAVRRFLAEFLSDPRVVELPRAVWLPLLHALILPLRSRSAARAYATIWQADGSPLLTLSQRLAHALEMALQEVAGDRAVVALGMRYGQPSIDSALQRLHEAGARRILVLPLYPQYAAATTASIHDAVFAHCARLRWIPALRFVTDYHDDAGYIAALTQSVTEFWSGRGRPERLLMSFHGIPRAASLLGDPYYGQCLATATHLSEALALPANEWRVSFQSRVGPKRWLEPYTDATLAALAAAGVKTVDVVCPGFAVDCLETLEEIALRNAEDFRRAGGHELRYIPALNDNQAHVAALAGLVLANVGGWTSTRIDGDEQPATSALERKLDAPR